MEEGESGRIIVPGSIEPEASELPNLVNVYKSICRNPEFITDINPRIIDPATASLYRLTLANIMAIKDQEVRAVGVAQWFERIRLHLGYYESKRRYIERGKEPPKEKERLEREGAKDIEEELGARFSELRVALSRLEGRIVRLG